jgi:hypothetical protein
MPKTATEETESVATADETPSAQHDAEPPPMRPEDNNIPHGKTAKKPRSVSRASPTRAARAAPEFLLPKAPPRTTLPEPKARKFERERSPAPAKEIRSTLRRTESGERVSGYVPPELAEALRVRCALERRSFSDALTDALSAWLKISPKH